MCYVKEMGHFGDKSAKEVLSAASLLETMLLAGCESERCVSCLC